MVVIRELPLSGLSLSFLFCLLKFLIMGNAIPHVFWRVNLLYVFVSDVSFLRTDAKLSHIGVNSLSDLVIVLLEGGETCFQIKLFVSPEHVQHQVVSVLLPSPPFNCKV